MTIRSRKSLIMSLIGPEHLALFALEREKLLYFSLFTLATTLATTNINQSALGQNIYDHKISDEFDYGSNRSRTSGVICP